MSDKRKYADRRQYLVKAVIKRRKMLRQKAIEYKGGICSICGYGKCKDALEFHYSGKKNFGISEGNTRSWLRMKPELDKCILVCANCHREIHSQLQSETAE
jgi:predicted HNH restriction endonuclease